jgi:hypothetical protein
MGREETPEDFLGIERPKRNGSLTGKASGEKKEEPPGLRLPGGIMKNISNQEEVLLALFNSIDSLAL